MRFSKRFVHQLRFILLWLSFGLVGVVFAASDNLIVITNSASPIKQLSAAQIKSIYLGKTNKIDQQVVRGYDQPTGSTLYNQFYQTVFNWTSRQVNGYWSARVFSGNLSQPPQLPTEQAAIELVSKYKGVIAYVSSRALALSPYRNKIHVLYGDYHPVYNTGGYHSADGLPAPPPLASDSSSPAASTSNANQASATTDATAQPSTVKTPATPSPPPAAQAAPPPIASPSTPVSTDPVFSQAASSGLSGGGSSTEDVFASSAGTAPQTSVWQSIIAGYQFNDYSRNAQVLKQQTLYLRNPKSFEQALKNATPYIGYVYQQVKQSKLPSEFALLPIIESGYDPFAYSRVGATGLWQIMPATAAGDYGLSIDWWYDQRRDILTSTKAAVAYLSRLHQSLGSWLLAAAAYNSGLGTVRNAIKRADRSGASSNFWSLQLPTETREYVPRLIAVSQIIKHAKQYGIELPPIPDKPFFNIVALQSQMDLGEISKLSGVSINQIRSLNPGMRRWATSPTGTFNLLLPAGSVNKFQDNLKSLDGKKQVSWQYHEVHDKESLATIAKDYHTTVAFLQTVNSLTSATVAAGQGLLVPIRLNFSYDTGGVSLSSKESGGVKSLTVDDLLGGTDSSTDNVEKQMSQLKLNQEDPVQTKQADPAKASDTDSSDDSLKQMISKIYGED